MCTLRAALQESNALSAADDVVIAPAADVDSATPAVQSTGTIVGQGSGPANWMYSGVLTPWGDGGALFMATRRVTLDFQNRLGIRSLNDGDPVSAIYLNGSDVTIRNFSNIRSNETAFVVGGAGDRAMIENGSSVDPGSIDLERVLWLANGADGVTVRNVEMGSTYSGGGSAIRIADNATVNDLTLDHVRMYDPDAEGYQGIGMQSTGTLNRLRIVGSTFEGFPSGYFPINLVGATVNDGVISGNTFTRINSGGAATIWISRPGTNNVIRSNVFRNTAADTASYGVYFSGLGLAATTASGWVVEDNYFNGRRSWSVFIGTGSGILPVRRNTFGPDSFGGGTAANEIDTTALVFNEGTANQKVNTWYPTTVALNPTTCQLDVTVTPPTAIPIPATPVRIDVFYTPTTKAEIYLGGQSGLTAASVVSVPYSLGAGNVRVQTTAASGATSQYSRVLAQPQADICGPRATLNQAASQADPTSVRTITFTAQFSEAIVEELLPAAVATTGSTAPGVRVTAVTRTSASVFTVTARADGSGTVVLTLPAGGVRDAAGNPSLAATSTDNSVSYASPLSLAPTSVAVTEGGAGQAYTVTASLAATAPISVQPTVADPAWATVAPQPLTLDTTATIGQMTVTAVDDALVNGTRSTSVAHVVRSADANFDGLLLPAVAVTVSDNDHPVAANSTLTLSGGPQVANGVAAYTATATVRNAANTPVGGILVTFQTDPAAHLSGGSCTTAANGNCSIQVSSVTPGTYPVRAFVGGAPIGGSPASAEFVAGPPDPTTSTISSSVLTLPSDGSSTATITVRLKDAQGNDVPVGGAVVTVQTSAGTMSGVTDNGDSTYAATLTAATVVGTAVVSYAVGGAPGAQTVTINFVAGAPSASTSTIAALPPQIVADGASASTVTITLLDGYGNPVTAGGDDVEVTASAGSLGPLTDNGDGTYTVVLTAATSVQTAVVRFAVNGASAPTAVSVAFVAGPVSPGTSTIAANPTSVVADVVSQSAVTVMLRDAHGNVVVGSGALVALATTAGTLSGVTDNGDGTFTAILTAATAPGTAEISFTIDGAAGGATAEVRFLAGAPDPDSSLIAATPRDIVADGSATATVTVTVRDAHGNVLTEGGADVVITTNRGSVSAVTDNGDGTYTATLTSATTVGTATQSFSVNGSASSVTAIVQFVPGAADPETSEIGAEPVSLPADGTSASTVTITLRDAQGNLLTSGGDTVTVATTIGTFGVATDNGDGTYTAFLTSTVVGTATVTFTVNGAAVAGAATVDFTAGAADPATSTIEADPESATADGTAASTVTVTLWDGNGNPATGGVSLETTLGALSGVTDNGDSRYTATITSTTAGTATITFTVDGVAGVDSAAVEFVPGAADPETSEITADPASIVADGASTSNVTVQLVDANGNDLTTSGWTVVIATDAGTVSGTTDNGDGTYAATLTSATTAGTATLSFAVEGVAADATATVEFTPGAADPGTSDITAGPASIVADGSSTSTVTVQLKDANGNDLTATGGAVVIATDAGTISDTTDNGDGTYTATLTSALSAGAANLSFTLGGVAGAATATVQFTPGAADPGTSEITADPTSIVADGSSTSTVTVQLKDANGNDLTATGGAVVIATDAGTISDTTDNGDGTYTATLTSAVTVGSATLTFALEGVSGDDTATVEFVAGAADPGRSEITAVPASIVADGSSTSTVTVQLKDTNGNDLTESGGTVVVSASSGTISTTSDTGDGTYTATLTSSTTAGTATLTFTIDGAPADDTAGVAFTPGAADPRRSEITAVPASIPADGSSTSTVTVQLKDANGNDLTASGGTVVMSTDAGTISATTDTGDGTYTATLTAPTTAGTATLTFTIDGAPADDTAGVAFTPGAADPRRSEITAVPASITADGSSTSTVTVQLKDANGNDLTASGGTVVISTSVGAISATSHNGDGSYTATLTASTTAGTATLTFTVNGADAAAEATVTFAPGAPESSTSTIASDPTSITADGSSTSTVTVRLRDANGNEITRGGAAVTMSATAGSLSTVVDNNDGTYTATLTSRRSAGTATISFAVNSTPADATATVTFTAGGADPDTSEITADPTSIVADGSSTSTVTVQLKDANGNDLTATGGAVVIATDAGTISDTTDNGDGTYTAALTSATTAGNATATFTIDGAQAADGATVAFTPGAPDPGTSEITADPTSLTADGSSTSTVTVRLKDANGNDLTQSGGTVVIATDAGTLSATTDNQDGTYTATVTAATTVGTATLTFTIGGAAADDAATVQFGAGPADAGTSTISASLVDLVADGTAASVVTVQVEDANGNNLSTGGAAVTMATTAGTLSGVVDNGDGTYQATLTAPTAAGQAMVSFTLDGAPGGNTVVVTFTAGEPSPSQSEISADPTSLAAGGSATSTVTVRLLDAFGNAVTTGGAEVVVSTDAGIMGATTDNGDGTYTATLTAPTAAGTATLTFTVGGDDATDTATVRFLPGPADPARSTIAASPDSIAADGSSTATVTARLRDTNGNPLSTGGATVVISTSAGTVGPTTDNGDGTYTATLTSATSAGAATLAFTVDGVSGGATATVAFTVGAADPGASEISGNPTGGVESDGQDSSQITVTLRDGQGNQLPTGGDEVELSTTRGTLSDVVDNGNGTYTATLVSTTPGPAVVRFTVNGLDGSAAATVEFVDTTAPEPPVVKVPADGASVRPDVPISGSGEPGATATVTVGGAEVCTATVDRAGAWTCFPSSPLLAGETTLTATQTDASGNTSQPSAAVTITVDDSRPAPPHLDATNGETVTGTAEPRTTITIRDSGGTVVCRTTTDADGTFTCTPEPSLPEGTLITATATDEAGNESEPDVVRVGGPSIVLDLDVVVQGAQRQVATGRGFLPDEGVSALLESTPIKLGTRTADANGVVTFLIDLPADLSVGRHTVTLTGELSGPVAADFRVVVAPEEPATPGTPSTPDLPPSPPELPGTGSPVSGWVVVLAAGCLIFGAGLLAVSRRRRARVHG